MEQPDRGLIWNDRGAAERDLISSRWPNDHVAEPEMVSDRNLAGPLIA